MFDDFTNSSDSLTVGNSSTGKTGVAMLVKIYQGTTYYSPTGSGNDWQSVQVQQGTNPITPPDISVINGLGDHYKNYSYIDDDSINILSFSQHQGQDNLGDNVPFPMLFQVPATFTVISLGWKIVGSHVGKCQIVNSNRIGKYQIQASANDWQELGCVQYGTPAGRSFPWVYPPSNDYLAGYDITSDLMFTDAQRSAALPTFMANSDSGLSGLDQAFDVTMTKYVINF